MLFVCNNATQKIFPFDIYINYFVSGDMWRLKPLKVLHKNCSPIRSLMANWCHNARLRQDGFSNFNQQLTYEWYILYLVAIELPSYTMKKETCVKGLAIMISFAIAIQCGVYIAYNNKIRFQADQVAYISRVFYNSSWSNTSTWTAKTVQIRKNETTLTMLTNTTKGSPLPICPLMPPNLGNLSLQFKD